MDDVLFNREKELKIVNSFKKDNKQLFHIDGEVAEFEHFVKFE